MSASSSWRNSESRGAPGEEAPSEGDSRFLHDEGCAHHEQERGGGEHLAAAVLATAFNTGAHESRLETTTTAITPVPSQRPSSRPRRASRIAQQRQEREQRDHRHVLKSNTAKASRPWRVASCLRSASEARTSAVEDIARPKPATRAAPENPNAARSRRAPRRSRALRAAEAIGRRNTQAARLQLSRREKAAAPRELGELQRGLDIADHPEPEGPISMPRPEIAETRAPLRRWKSGTSSYRGQKKDGCLFEQMHGENPEEGLPHYARATRPRTGAARGHSARREHTERPHLVPVHDEGHLLVLPLHAAT